MGEGTERDRGDIWEREKSTGRGGGDTGEGRVLGGEDEIYGREKYREGWMR